MPVVMTTKPMVSGIDEGSVFRADEPTSKRQSPSLGPRGVSMICGGFLQTGTGKTQMGELRPGHQGGAGELGHLMTGVQHGGTT